MAIEARFTDGFDALLARQGFNLRPIGCLSLGRVIGVNANARPNARIVLRQLQGCPAGGQRGANAHHAGHASRLGVLDDLLHIVGKSLVSEVAMRVDPSWHALPQQYRDYLIVETALLPE